MRPFIFLSKWRSLPAYEMISYLFMFASVPMLAYGIQPYNHEIISVIVLTVFTMYSGFFAALIWNDVTDSDIDAVVHPDRPIPSCRISSKEFFGIALVFSVMTFIFAALVSIWCLILTGVVALFVTFHNKYLKKTVKLPAYSEIFTPIQWVVVVIFGFLAIWTALPQTTEILIAVPFFGSISTSGATVQHMILLVIFTYFADSAHDVAEGIHDAIGDHKVGVRTFTTSFGSKTAARISFSMFFISGILGVALYFSTPLTPIFLIPFLAIWVYTLYHSYNLVNADEKEMKEVGMIVGRKGFNYFLIAYDLIFIDVLIQILIF